MKLFSQVFRLASTKYSQSLRCGSLSDHTLVHIGRQSRIYFSMRWIISLVCPNGNHDPIPLPHKEPVYIGRMPDTRIVDPRCSRKQVKVIADWKTGQVEAVQTGTNSSALDGMEMIKDKVYIMKQSSILHVLTGFYPQKLKFEKNHIQNSSDRKLSDSTHSSSSKNGSDSKVNESKDKTASHRNSSHKKEESGSGKRKASTEHGTESVFKKPKLNGDASSDHSGSKNDSEEKEHLKTVAANLQRLKQKGKGLMTPPKSLGSDTSKSKSSSSTPTSFSGLIPGGSSKSGNRQTAAESKWDQHGTCYMFTCKGLESREKIAGFDIDGTIITTQSGKVFPTNPDDWRFLYERETKKKIKKLYEEGYKIVFFTNQMGVSRGKTKIEDLKTKFADVLDDLNVPVQILISTKSDIYRKPAHGMWKLLCEKGNDGIPIDKSSSFYVGDAAGRPKDWTPKKKKDFSCGDRLFATNLEIDFKTPEEFFVGYPTNRHDMPEFDPRKLDKKIPLLSPTDTDLPFPTREIIVMVGSPASGKSHFCHQYLIPHGYVHVSRDNLGTWQKCLTACKEAIKQAKSVVIDNTNPDPESRSRYTNTAAQMGVVCRCFVMTTSAAHAKHNERFREITDKSHQPINDMVLNSYKKKYVPPEKKEGFSEIVKVNFKLKFSDSEKKELYRMFLVEK